MFNGNDYYTNKRKQHKLVYEDKAKGKEVMENLLDATKRMSEETKSPYKRYGLTEEGVKAYGGRRKTEADHKMSKEMGEKVKESVYNNSQAYRNLGKR